jgi:hypothetical protein
MRFKSWLKRTIAAIVLGLLIRTIWLVGKREWHRAEGNRAYTAAVTETEATDSNWRWDALQATRKIPAPERNSAIMIRKVSDISPPEWLVQKGGRKWEPNTPPLPANARFSKQIVEELRSTMIPARPSVELAVTLKDYPVGYTAIELTPDVISTKLPHIDAVRHVVALLRWEVVLGLEDDNAGRAVGAVIAMLNASRSIGDDPFMICQLVRMSTRVIATRSLERLLAQTQLTDQQLATLQNAWAEDADEPLLLHAFRGERATLDVMVANLVDGTDKPEPGSGVDGSLGRFGWWLYRGRLVKDRAYLHHYLTQAVALARLPLHEQQDMITKLPALPDESMKIAGLFLPAVEKCAAAYWRTTAEERCAVVAIACERFRVKHGKWPQSLSELCPEFLAAIPLDPFDGLPLQLTKQNDGIVLHSVGRNTQLLATGAAHPGLPEGIEIGFRLWNPETRRQPAPSKPDENKP